MQLEAVDNDSDSDNLVREDGLHNNMVRVETFRVEELGNNMAREQTLRLAGLGRP